jgi:serine-threonine kinase receptor-associated protein
MPHSPGGGGGATTDSKTVVFYPVFFFLTKMAAVLAELRGGQTRQVPIVCPGHTRPLTEVFYSPITLDGSFLISGCHDKMPMLRRGDNGDWIGTFAGHKGAVWAAKLDNEALLAATGAADFSAKLWDAITGKELHEFAHKHIVKSVEFSKDRRSLITAGAEGKLRLFDLESTSLAADLPHDPTQKLAINKAVYAADPNLVLTGASNGSVRVWDMRTQTMSFEVNNTNRLVMDMELSATTGGEVLTVASGSTVSIFDGRTFELLHAHEMPINFAEEGGASMHPSGERFIAVRA